MEQQKDYLTNSVENKNVLITGGTTGIGRATAILLAKNAANVIIVGRTESHMHDALRDIEKTARGKSYGVIADVGNEDGINKIFEEVDDKFGKLDILINNASLPFGSIYYGDYKDLDYLLKTNLLAYLACSAEAIKRMNSKGHIVNIGSMSADVRENASSVYVAAKSGIQGFSESIRKEFNPQGIKVSLIEPGAVDTDMQGESTEKKKENVENLEMLTADDIANSVLYCISQPERCDVVVLKIRPHRQFI